MDFFTTLVFFGKVILIDIVVELLRQALYAVWHNSWALKLLHLTQKNKYFDWFLQAIELATIIALLNMGYSVIATIMLVFILTIVLKELGNALLVRFL